MYFFVFDSTVALVLGFVVVNADAVAVVLSGAPRVKCRLLTRETHLPGRCHRNARNSRRENQYLATFGGLLGCNLSMTEYADDCRAFP